MTGQPLDELTEEFMRQCEGIQFTLRSPEWNALRARIRQISISPEMAYAWVHGRHETGNATSCLACQFPRKVKAIADNEPPEVTS